MIITTGKKETPVRAICYGPEGIGKTTFASQWPNPLYIDVEESTHHLDVARTPQPTSWTMFKSLIEELTKDAHGYQTVVIDTADWADKLAVTELCAKSNKIGIEDFGYGKGWVYLSEEWAKMLDLIAELQKKQRVHVLFLAHANIRKFELPNEAGAYDRYEMKMEKRSASLLKEWADLMLFANYKTIVVNIDGKKKAQGGSRVMYTSHHPTWDAKNRFGLADELPFEFKSVSGIFKMENSVKTETKKNVEPPKTVISPVDSPKEEVQSEEKTPDNSLPKCLPEKLRDLMAMSAVTVEELKAICNKTYPVDTPIENYDPKFFEGNIIPNWNKAMALIEKIRNAKKTA